MSAEGLVGVLATKVKAVQRGDLADVEALLIAQAVSLNSIYTGCVTVARRNLAERLDAAERMMRLGLKAQSQCRATLETLATIKNPPTVFARQANVAHGPQQVNNVMAVAGNPVVAAHARAGNLESQPNKLLEAHGERLDLGATSTTGPGNQDVAAVGAVHRPANG